MSNFTTELRYPLTMGKDIGLKSYPIFDEYYRDILNQKIIEHFWFREIGFETFERFKIALNVKMCEIMPYYNLLYAEHVNTLLSNKDITITEHNNYFGDKEANENNRIQNINHDIGASGSVDAGEYKQSQSDTPMGKLNNIYSDDYATETRKGENTDKSNTRTENWNAGESEQEAQNRQKANTTENKFLRRFGLEGDKLKADYFLKFKDSLLNIDMMIINDLESLFFGLWS